MDEEYLEALRKLKKRLLKLRREKAGLLDLLDNLEADGQTEADVLEKEIAELQFLLEEKKKRERDVVFRF